MSAHILLHTAVSKNCWASGWQHAGVVVLQLRSQHEVLWVVRAVEVPVSFCISTRPGTVAVQVGKKPVLDRCPALCKDKHDFQFPGAGFVSVSEALRPCPAYAPTVVRFH